MPRFHFDVFDGSALVPDVVGQEVASVAATREVALAILLEVMHPVPGGNDHRVEVSVRGGSGEVVLRTRLSLVVEWQLTRERCRSGG